MAPKKVIKKTEGTEAEEAILQWFECEGEPATVQSLTDALGSKFGKSLVQSVLEQCLEEGKLQAKDIKKARFYFLLSPEVTENSSEGGRPLDTAKVELLKQLQQQTRSLFDASVELNILLQKPSASERTANIAELLVECATLRQRLNDMRLETSKNRDQVGCEDVLLFIRRYNRARQFWRERKRMTERVIDAIFGESCDTKDLTDHFGLITDQGAGVSLAEIDIALPSIEGIAVE